MKLNMEYRDACWAVGDYSCQDAKKIRMNPPTKPVHYGNIHGEDGEYIEVWIEWNGHGWNGYLHIQGNKKLALRFNDMNLLAKMMYSTGDSYDWYPVYKKRGKYYMIGEIDWYKNND